MRLTFLFLFIICAIGVIAQDNGPKKCAGIVEETDSIQGSFTRTFKEKLIVANSPDDLLQFDLKQFNEAIVFSVLVKGAGDCLDENSKLTVDFASGEKLVIAMDGQFNCDNEFVVFFGGSFGKKKEFKMFLENPIDKLRIETRKSAIDKKRKNFVEVKFSEQQRKDFLDRLDCLVD